MRSTHRRPARLAVSLVVGGTLLLSLAAPSMPAGADDGLTIVGKLPQPLAAERFNSDSILQIDATRRLMYYVWQSAKTLDAHVVEYDIRPRIPQRIRDANVGGDFPTANSPYLTTLDDKRRMIMFLDNLAVGTVVRRFDIRSFALQQQWDLNTTLPGFVGYGITYSRDDDRFYLVGEMSGYGQAQEAANAFVRPIAPVTTVVALEAASGELAWARPVAQCEQLLTTFGIGTLVARSTVRPTLSFFCYSGGVETGGAASVTFPGLTGLVRLAIAGKATQAEALEFPVELFPVSGAYKVFGGDSGLAGLDHAADRFFVQSVSPATPGAWVFDGNSSSWVGLIAAPDAKDLFLAINEGTGHYYIGSQSPSVTEGYIVVSNARTTPPPQGDVFRFPSRKFLFAEPHSRRLFANLWEKDGTTNWYVLEDTTPDPEPPDVIDYDDLTTDIAEGQGTISSYSGSVTGFGSRVFLVGGVGGASSFFNSGDAGAQFQAELIQPIVNALGAPLPAITPGDRGLYMARVGSTDLRNSGASASAQPAVPDSLTEADLLNTRTFVETTPAKPTADVIVWPYPAATCLDGGGDRQEKATTGPGGDGKADCDLAKNVSSASTSFRAVSIGPLTVGYSSFSTESRRDPSLGALTDTIAVSRNVDLTFPGVGALSIGRVTATARTVAHGRPGTARVEYARRIQDVTVTDAGGAETFSCQATCDPQQVTDAVNATLGVKVRMEVPVPEKVATTRGAFSGVEKTRRDYIGGLAQNNDNSRALPAVQFSINNDSASKSRILVQLSAIQASSIYGISLLSDFGGDGGGGSLLPETPPLPGTALGPALPESPSALPPAISGTRSRGLRGAFLLARSPRDVAVVALILLVIGGAIVAAYRRQMLLQGLEDA